MTPEQIRILAGIKPVPPRSQMPPPVLEATRVKMSIDEAQRLAGMPVSEQAAPTPKATPTPKVTPKVTESSGEFDDDMNKISSHLIEALNLLKHENMKYHIKEANENYLTKASHARDVAVAAVRHAMDAVKQLYEAK